MHGQVHHAMLANLFQHVVEEAQARLDVTMSVAVQIYLNIYVCLLGGTLYFCCPFAAKSYLGSLVPTANLQESAADVLGKLAVGVAVAYDVAMLDVVFGIVNIFLNQTRIGFTRRRIVFRKVWVDENVVERYAFALQRIEDEVMHGPEGILGECVGTQSVLIADHHELVVGMLSQEYQVTYGARHEFQFLEGVYLFVSRFLDDGAVAVNEENFFHLMFCFCCSRSSSFVSMLPYM